MNQLNILGYRGSYLALIFETLTTLKFSGKINIIINEEEKKAIAPFETNIPYAEYFITDIKKPLSGKYIFCSNKPSTKRFLLDLYKNLWGVNNIDFFKLIHPSSVIASTVKSGEGIQVEPLSVISPYTEIGFGVNIGRNCSIGHHNKLGDFCSVHLGSNIAGHVEIGEGTTIGPGTTIFSKTRIGANTLIGGGSVVTKDIPSNVLAFGNPCQIVKKLD
ncbi:MAG: hypothetical protein JW833_16145 [Prolixibacteraceae bacterium]|nr:hypothetical protein [Prolixibacteraceae bacterium]